MGVPFERGFEVVTAVHHLAGDLGIASLGRVVEAPRTVECEAADEGEDDQQRCSGPRRHATALYGDLPESGSDFARR